MAWGSPLAHASGAQSLFAKDKEYAAFKQQVEEEVAGSWALERAKFEAQVQMLQAKIDRLETSVEVEKGDRLGGRESRDVEAEGQALDVRVRQEDVDTLTADVKALQGEVRRYV